MKDFLSKILTDHSFQEIKPKAESGTDSKKDFLFKYKEHDEEYYFLSEYGKDELGKYFSNSDRSQSFFNYLESSQKDYPNVKKNSSQIIFVEVKSLVDDFKKLKNQIYKIEEDEFFLKKYILLYTSKTIEGLKTLSINELQKRLYNLKSFDNFFSKGLADDIDTEYFLLTQLFIKLPFIKLSEGKKEFEPLDEIINQQLSENKLEDFQRRLFMDNQDEESPYEKLDCLEPEHIKNSNDLTIDEQLDSIITALGLT
jgi:hypothetical protein